MSFEINSTTVLGGLHIHPAKSSCITPRMRNSFLLLGHCVSMVEQAHHLLGEDHYGLVGSCARASSIALALSLRTTLVNVCRKPLLSRSYVVRVDSCFSNHILAESSKAKVYMLQFLVRVPVVESCDSFIVLQPGFRVFR